MKSLEDWNFKAKNNLHFSLLNSWVLFVSKFGSVSSFPSCSLALNGLIPFYNFSFWLLCFELFEYFSILGLFADFIKVVAEVPIVYFEFPFVLFDFLEFSLVVFSIIFVFLSFLAFSEVPFVFTQEFLAFLQELFPPKTKN